MNPSEYGSACIVASHGNDPRAPSLRSGVSSTFKRKRVFTLAAIALPVVAGLSFAVLMVRDFSMKPRAERVYPYADEVGVEPNTAITLYFNKAMSPGTILPETFMLRDEHGSVIPGKATYDDATRTAVLHPISARMRAPHTR
jgi:hypothetical protein